MIQVSIIWKTFGKLHLVSSIIVFNWRASTKILSDTLFFTILTGLMKVFSVEWKSVFTGAMISNCVKISSKCCTLSCN